MTFEEFKRKEVLSVTPDENSIWNQMGIKRPDATVLKIKSDTTFTDLFEA